MLKPKLTVIFTLNNRTDETQRKVYESFIGQDYDQMIIVLDRPEPGVGEYAKRWWDSNGDIKPIFVEVDGERGWLGPARAWNEGFKYIEHELTCMISSEVIQSPGNCGFIKEALSGPPLVVFGKAKDDGPIPLVTGPEPSILCSSKHPRPLGFIWAMPTWVIRAVKGFDEEFMKGYWYDDDDLTYRIWLFGLPYYFDDRIYGIHQHHDRQDLDTERGRAMIQKNKQYIIRQHGSEHPWDHAPKQFIHGQGRALILPTEDPAAMAYYEALIPGGEFTA